MAVGRIRVEGGPKLRRALAQAEGALEDLTRVNRAVAEIVADRARDTAPVGPPSVHVRDTIRPAGTKAAAIVRAGRKRVPYAMPLHWGHRTPNGTVVRPQPWIAQAAQDTQERWTALYSRELDRIVTTVERTATP